MSKSTPINQIPEINENTDSSNQLVQEIINEIQAQETQTDNQPQQEVMQQETQQPMMMQQQQPVMMEQNIEEPKLSFVQKIMNNVLDNSKEASVVSAITLFLSLPAVNAILLKYIPRMMSSDGQISTSGIIIKALLAGVVFFLVRKMM